MGESLEVRGLRGWMAASGVGHRVTSTCRPAGGSYHGRVGTGGCGLAVDLAGPEPGADTAELAAVYRALVPLGPSCAELIYSGPGGGYWAQGRPVGPYAAAGHHNHVHVAVPLGWRLEAHREALMAGKDIVAFHPTPDGKGYWIVTADGAVFAFGTAGYHGGLQMDGAGYWQLRT